MTLFFIQFNFLDITVPGRVSPKHNILRRHLETYIHNIYYSLLFRFSFCSLVACTWS